jgi:hypothetical protein
MVTERAWGIRLVTTRIPLPKVILLKSSPTLFSFQDGFSAQADFPIAIDFKDLDRYPVPFLQDITHLIDTL